MKLHFPKERPDCSPTALWEVQQTLLIQAETLFGARDSKKTICQPVFKGSGPCLINTPDLGGAFVALSMNAAGYWPTVVYEMAHETVHLLDPIVGYTNWLEEGIAVAFSVAMSETLTEHPMTPDIRFPSYLQALTLVQSLPVPCFDVARRVRAEVGSLSAASVESLRLVLQNVDEGLLQSLAEQCKPR